MVDIQFNSQENPSNFSEANQPMPPFTANVVKEEKSNKLIPWAIGIGLAIIGGAVLYKVYLGRQDSATTVAEATPVPTPTPPPETSPSSSRISTTVRSSSNPSTDQTAADSESTEPDIVTKGGTISTTAASTKTPSTPTPAPVVSQSTVQVVKTVQAAPTYAQIYGTVTVNGSIPDNSTILVLYRPVGNSEFTAGPRLSAYNGVSWSLSLPTGRNYEITLAWQINENNLLTSDKVIVTAPISLRTVFNFNQNNNNCCNSCSNCCNNSCNNCSCNNNCSNCNSNNSNHNYYLKPDAAILDTCGNWSDNRWHSAIVLPKYAYGDAISYHVQIGTNEGNNNVYDHTFDQDQRVLFHYDLEDDKDYYVRFQIKTKDSGSSYGDWSNSVKIKCQH